MIPALAALVLCASPGPSAPPALTLADALQYAASRNPALAAARAQVEQGRLAARVPRNRWLPQVGATAQLLAATDNNSTAVTLASPSVPLPRVGGAPYNPDLTFAASESWKPYASSIAGVGISQQVFDFGLTAAQTAAADAALEAQTHDLQTQVLDTRLAVTVAFRAVQAAHAVQSAAQAAVLRSQVHRDQAAALVSGGLRSRIFLERADAELARLRIGALRAESGLTVARAGFATAMGFDGPEVDAAGEVNPETQLPALGAALDAALANAPELKALGSTLEAQREAANAVADLTRPAIFVTASVSGRAGGTPAATGSPALEGFAPEVPNWDVGVVANWSFFDPVTLAQARAAHAQEQVIARQVDAMAQKVRAAATDAWVRAREANQALPELEVAFQAAKGNYEQADVRFTQGLGTSVEIADAETLLTDAEINVAEGRFDLGRTVAQLERAMAGGL